MVKHYFLETCQSTQSSFKEYWAQHDKSDPHLLISANNQTTGLGRRGNQWYSNANSLAMSFSIKAQANLSLTPLHLALVICQYFEAQKISLSLKWPNDLLNQQGEKVGGILCQVLDSDYVLAGVGLNLFFDEQDFKVVSTFPYPINHLNLPHMNKKKMAEDIYEYLLRASEFSATDWNRYCNHLNSNVEVIDGEQKICGQFLGIDHLGAAIIKNHDDTVKVYTGSLRISG